jgi:hypothetical protein
MKTITFLLIIALCLTIAGWYFLLAPPTPLPLNHVCDYTACCTGDQDHKYFVCDYEGCSDSIPNWTPPNCSVAQ